MVYDSSIYFTMHDNNKLNIRLCLTYDITICRFKHLEENNKFLKIVEKRVRKQLI